MLGIGGLPGIKGRPGVGGLPGKEGRPGIRGLPGTGGYLGQETYRDVQETYEYVRQEAYLG